MAWWREARFGMFIHWGLYAIPAGEWNGETNHAEWIRTTAQIPLEEYDRFLNEFNPVDFDATAWVKMAKEAGMKYIVITSKHHDGFCLFDSEYTGFDVMSTPFKRDILKELSDACHKEGIKICWYHSIMDWHHPNYLPRRGWETSRSNEGASMDRYIEYMKNQLSELVGNYGEVGVLWFDGEWEGTWTHEHGRELYHYVKNLQPNIIINNRVDKGRSGMAGLTREGGYMGDFGTPEQEIPETGLPGVDWESCMTMNDHWGYNKHDTHWKSTGDLIRKLVDIASKGDNFLLNVGPKADGTFPEESVIRLREIGKWMKANGESIYGTTASPFQHLTWGRCTQKKTEDRHLLYMHVFHWPEENILRIPGLFTDPNSVFLLPGAENTNLVTKRDEDAVLVHLPPDPPDTVNTVVALEFNEEPDISQPPEITASHRIFIDTLHVRIETKRPDITLRYTLDGTIPCEGSKIFHKDLILDHTARVIARCFRKGKPVSDTVSAFFQKVDPLPPAETGNVTPGITYRYYEGDWDRLPDFTRLNPVNQGITDKISVDIKRRDDHYGIVFEGLIKIERPGVYTFYTDSDDGSRLYIGDRLVVDNDGLHGMEEEGGEIALEKGYHRIGVEYFEKGGSDDLWVRISGPGIKKMELPGRLLFK